MGSILGPEPRTDRVEGGARSTDIRIGADLLRHLWAAVRSRFPEAAACGLAVDEHVASLHPLPRPPADLEVLAVRLPRGEAAKTRTVLSTLQDAWLPLRRDEPVIAIGGGAALDVAGFAAATVRRGLPWIAVPTTVVAMADASVGGKTAVNHERGKNLLGTFHPPTLVLSDVATLATLEVGERVAGLAEVYKAARIGEAGLLEVLRAGAPATPAAWIDVLQRAIAIKARLVEADERDHGVRRVLNYGHTVGHALERTLGLRHGEAVAIGMDVAARIALARGLMTAGERDQQRRDLLGLGLPVDVPAGGLGPAFEAALGLDKKRIAGTDFVFVLPVGSHGVRVVDDVQAAEIAAALA